MEPVEVKCSHCGETVVCRDFTNFCVCGEMYNFSGDHLAPVEEWDVEDVYGTFGPQGDYDD